MLKENIYEGPGSLAAESYVLDIIIILIGAFIFGYWLRHLLNSGLNKKVTDLERELLLLKDKATINETAEQELESLLERTREQNAAIDELNGELTELRSGKMDLENKLLAARVERDKAIENAKQTIDSPVREVNETDASAVQIAEPQLDEEEPKSILTDDLKRIEGVGPKIESLLNAESIFSFSDIIGVSSEHIKGILIAAGANYAVHDPTTWSEQAQLAKEGKWEELEQFQQGLKGGKRK